MKFQGTVVKVEPNKIVIQHPNGKLLTVRRNDDARFEKYPTTFLHTIGIHGFDEWWNLNSKRDILGLAVDVDADELILIVSEHHVTELA